MKKSRNWWNGPPPPGPIGRLMDADAGKGLSDKPSDTAYWLADDAELLRWIDAFAAVDRKSDPGELIALLAPLVPEPVRPHLADLLRRKLEPLKGRPRQPSYERSAAETTLDAICAFVRADVKAGMTVGRALEKQSAAHGVPSSVLEHAYKEKRGSRRKKSGRS